MTMCPSSLWLVHRIMSILHFQRFIFVFNDKLQHKKKNHPVLSVWELRGSGQGSWEM